MYLIDIIISLLYENVIRRKQPPVCVYLMLAYLLCICAEDVDYNFWFGFFFFLARICFGPIIDLQYLSCSTRTHSTRIEAVASTAYDLFIIFFCFFVLFGFFFLSLLWIGLVQFVLSHLIFFHTFIAYPHRAILDDSTSRARRMALPVCKFYSKKSPQNRLRPRAKLDSWTTPKIKILTNSQLFQIKFSASGEHQIFRWFWRVEFAHG